MIIPRIEYQRFLTTEIEKQEKEYEQTANTNAIVLKNKGEVFVGRFLTILENGMAVFKVRNSDLLPRKNSFWTATIFNGQMASFKNWGDNSWIELCQSYQNIYSDAHCAWISKSDDPGFCLIGVKGLTIDFASKLEEGLTIVAFGPQYPPLLYLVNLNKLVQDTQNEQLSNILDYDYSPTVWNPQMVSKAEDLTSLLKSSLEDSCCAIVQGPPGTGKTYRMAKLAAQLLSENKSVLVTALTNQALIELVKKDDIAPYLSQGKVSKTSITIDERHEVPKLEGIHENKCNATKGKLTLATFYISSGWAIEADEQPFDYIIMDEASQALLPMIAATLKLGKKVVWVGDQNQLAPILLINEDIINDNNWSSIVSGFNTICNYRINKSFMLVDSFRLTQRGAKSTGIFYNNNLNSVAEYQTITSCNEILHKEGGPVILELPLRVGDKIPPNAIDYIINLVCQLRAEDKDVEIAVLAKFKDTVRQLQKSFVQNSLTNEIPDKIKIETVDRVQGLTVDYCVFLIPNASIRYSLDKALFNVATSRARYNTIIIADKSIYRENMPEEVRKYLLKAQEDKFATFEPQTISAGNISLKIVDKIDVSSYSKRKTGIVEGKENIYIIDTNVFIDCPDIITRIGTKYKIIIPTKVLEELDKKKLCNNIDKQKINEAAKNIANAFVQKFSRMEQAEVSLLPSGFDKQNPDCMILSVALKYKHENPIILTSDKMMITRAIGLGITAVSLQDFLRK